MGAPVTIRPPGHDQSGSPAPVVVSVFSRREAVVQGLWLALWCLVLVTFWAWWLGSVEGKSVGRFWLNSIAVAWVTFLPLYFFSFVIRAREVRGPVALPPGSRVAMVVTKAPSEPWSVVRKTLEAMLAQDYPHDTWLADEDPDEGVRRWCAKRGVQISTRRGIAAYHQPQWPRRTRCKEGNLAYFYDTYGYERYDFVVQMDADHIPQPGYLREMLKPFADPKVGYVSAPSICDGNAASSWAARGRLYVEGTFHGLLQTGYAAGWAPMCIGSHYAVRTSALKDIGGLGPELAEDHSTTLLFNAKGWRGMHAFRARASGDGPATFADMITQEFQWSRSLMTILLTYTPRYWSGLRGWQKFQFAFSQLWYPLLGVIMLGITVMPVYALWTGAAYVDVPLIDFYLHIIWLGLIGSILAVWWKRRGLLRPVDAKIISWEGPLFVLSRWPWVLWGVISAIKDKCTGRVSEFRVTPKGTKVTEHLPFKAIAPYVFLSCLCTATAIFIGTPGEAAGFYLFCLLQGFFYALLAVVAWVMHARENGLPIVSFGPLPVRAMSAALLVLVLSPFAAFAMRHDQATEAILWGTERYNLTEVRHPASGAGRDGRAIRTIRLRLPWS